MIRSAGAVLVAATALVALAGCAHQESFGLPDLTPHGAAPGMQVYASYGYGNGAGYPSRYQPGYSGVYGYGNPYYAAQGPYPYGDGYAYNPYPQYLVVPCADSNRDGHCDARPPKQRHDRDPRGHDIDDHPVQPQHGDRDEAPRVRNSVVRDDPPNAQRRAVPVVQQPARVRPEPRRATSSPPTQEP